MLCKWIDFFDKIWYNINIVKGNLTKYLLEWEDEILMAKKEKKPYSDFVPYDKDSVSYDMKFLYKFSNFFTF